MFIAEYLSSADRSPPFAFHFSAFTAVPDKESLSLPLNAEA
jgi:hypothetical protein